MEQREGHMDYMTRRLREEALNDRRAKQKDSKNAMIWVTFSKEGLHKYPAALDDPKLATGDEYDVSFLGYIHRHIFKFKVWIQVFHDDRDIEFIQFKRWLEKLYSEKTLQLDYKSCEMMSDDLFKKISERYPERSVRIEVSEDGENGSDISYDYKRI